MSLTAICRSVRCAFLWAALPASLPPRGLFVGVHQLRGAHFKRLFGCHNVARTRDRCESARRRPGYDGDRIDARYRIADDRGPQGRWADVREPGARFAQPIRRSGA